MFASFYIFNEENNQRRVLKNNMKRSTSIALSVLLIITSFTMFISCGNGETVDNNETCSLDGISISTNEGGGTLFILDEKGLSDEILKQKKNITASLNEAISKYPNLSEVLSDDEKNQSSFLKTMPSFSDENFKKAQLMFPDITEEQFYYHSAIGYGIANKAVIEEITIGNVFDYITNAGTENEEKSPTTITLNTSFDDVMVHAFWASYFGERFETNLSFDQTDPTVYDEIIKNNPDPDVYGQLILDTPANLEMMIKSQIMFIPIAHEYEKWYKEEDITKKERDEFSTGIKYGGNNVLTKPLRETLNSYGLSDKPRDLSDEFMEIGTTAMTYLLLTQDNASKSGNGTQVGDMGWASARFIAFYDRSAGYDLLVGEMSFEFALDKEFVSGGNLLDWAWSDEKNLGGTGMLENKPK